MSIRSQDEIVAEAFWARPDAKGLLDRYAKDMDGELRNDMRKAGVYLHLRDQGVEHVWAAMTACRRCGRMVGSDLAFNEHARQRMGAMTPVLRESILRQAKKAGISTHGKYYCGGLGHYTDPCAWVSTTSDIVAACKSKNLSCDGVVRHRAVEMEPDPPVPLAEDLISESIADEVRASPEIQRRLKRDPERAIKNLRGLVVEKYGAST